MKKRKMDPNAILTTLREFSKRTINNPDNIDPDEVKEMAELFNSLDEWMSNEGFLPNAWNASGTRE